MGAAEDKLKKEGDVGKVLADKIREIMRRLKGAC